MTNESLTSPPEVRLSRKRGNRGTIALCACLEKMDSDSGRFAVFFRWLLFEGHRGEIAQRAVAPRRVVERFDVIEDDEFGGTSADGHCGVKTGLGFQRAPKRLHGRIVVAIAS